MFMRLLALFCVFNAHLGQRGALDLTAFQFATKELYVGQEVEEIVYKDQPFLAMVSKDEAFFGRNFPQPLVYANPQGRSASFAKAKANQGNTKGVEFLVTRSKDYSLATIDNETLEATKNDKGAFLQAAKTEIDGALMSISRSLGQALYGDGSGTIGQVGNSSYATAVLTLKDTNDVVNFEVGMVLGVSATSGGAARTGTLSVVSIDRDAGTVTMSGNLSAGVSAIAQNDYIFVDGDNGAKLSGLSAWIQGTSVASTAFFGVDRTKDKTRLAGIKQTLTGMPLEQALQKLAARIAREGGSPEWCFMSFDNYLALELSLGSRVQYNNVSSTVANIGFTGIKIAGPKKPITVIPDVNCPNDRFYMLTPSTWTLRSLGKAPKLFNGDGLEYVRLTDADSVEVRCYYYAQLACSAPGYNGVGIIK